MAGRQPYRSDRQHRWPTGCAGCRCESIQDGRGSYDVVAPRIRELLRLHRSRPIGARVTLDVVNTWMFLRIFEHLTEDMGFYEVGFAPVTSSTGLDYAIDGRRLRPAAWLSFASSPSAMSLRPSPATMWASPTSPTCCRRYTRAAAKAYPCGAGIGLLGVAPGGGSWPCATVSQAPATTTSASVATGCGCLEACRASGEEATSTIAPIAAPVGSAVFVPAAATTKRRCATATDSSPTCIIANGSVSGRLSGSTCTAESSSRTRRFSIGSWKGRPQ